MLEKPPTGLRSRFEKGGCWRELRETKVFESVLPNVVIIGFKNEPN